MYEMFEHLEYVFAKVQSFGGIGNVMMFHMASCA